MTLHVALRVCEPDVTVTVPFFTPGAPYTLVVVGPLPESPPVPVHAYVYVPVPPETVEDQVTVSPV